MGDALDNIRSDATSVELAVAAALDQAAATERIADALEALMPALRRLDLDDNWTDVGGRICANEDRNAWHWSCVHCTADGYTLTRDQAIRGFHAHRAASGGTP